MNTPRPTLHSALCLVVAFSSLGFQGCVGSDKPRSVERGRALDKPYVPPIDQNLLVPAAILRRNQEMLDSRAAINSVTTPRRRNAWQAHDEDVARALPKND
jgi:hypothetical protein